MSYIINKFSGEQLIVLEDGTIDTSTSINLVGRNYVGYGEAQNENFLWMLENFANEAPPSRPLAGQIWFNTTNNVAYVYDGTSWGPIGAATLSETEPTTPNAGTLWLRTTDNTLQVWLGDKWGFVGPESVAGFGVTRARSVALTDVAGHRRPVILLETNDSTFAVCTAEGFTISPSSSITGISNTLVAGINLSTNAMINGSITGNALTANTLTEPRNINGVPFSGANDITIKSSTTKPHKKGTYLVGNDFDGSGEVTWSVDATPSNTIGKVVARNSEGGFSAGTITATLIGNVTGDVTSNNVSNFNIVNATEFVGATLRGNATSATRLQTPRKINGVSFNGTADVTVTADAATLTNTYLNPDIKQSGLEQVGTLVGLSVNNPGVLIGSGGQLHLLVDSSKPTIRSSTGFLNFDMGPLGPDVSFVNATMSLSLGGPSAPAIIGDNTTNLGITGYSFDNVYANNFKGNADTATLATSATNVVGGGAGALVYQSGIGATTTLGLGADGYYLRARPGGPAWESLVFENLNKGSYVNMVNTTTTGDVSYFNSSVPVTISVDATSDNTSGKVVARDSSGNFKAGTITANLTGAVTGAASDNVLKVGDTMTGFLTLHSDPTSNLHAATKKYVDDTVNNKLYYDEFTNGVKSPGPQTFPQRSIRGFSAYSSTDFPGNYFGGVTVSGPSGVYSGQLAFNWNSEENAPTGLYFRVNDDTGVPASWSPWKQIATTDSNIGFGSGQSYVDVTSSRVLGGVYTNTTGKTIYCDVFTASGDNDYDDPYQWAIAFVNGVEVARQIWTRESGAPCWIMVGFFVPPGATYQVNFYTTDEAVNNASYGCWIARWTEFR